jgi:hypothetical protein
LATCDHTTLVIKATKDGKLDTSSAFVEGEAILGIGGQVARWPRYIHSAVEGPVLKRPTARWINDSNPLLPSSSGAFAAGTSIPITC